MYGRGRKTSAKSWKRYGGCGATGTMGASGVGRDSGPQVGGGGVSDRGVEGGEVFGRGEGVHQVRIEFLGRSHSYIISLKHFLKG